MHVLRYLFLTLIMLAMAQTGPPLLTSPILLIAAISLTADRAAEKTTLQFAGKVTA